MKAVCFHGSNDVRVERVPDPQLLNARDAIVRVTSTSICGSDLHLYDGYIPTVKQGDILGHEFMGEVVEVGRGVTNLAPGDRVVVPSIISCGACFYCKGELWSLCDNGNPNATIAEKAFGYSPTGIFGYSHMFGGYAGSHAEYVRVPFADVGPIKVPDGIADEKLLFISDAFPTGYMGADLCDIKPGDTVAVWGCGAVGQFAIKSAFLLGAGRVIGIDRFASRLETARRVSGAETLNYEDVDVVEALKDMTAGRGPDACIDAVGLEAHGTGAIGAYDMVKQQARLETDRPHVLREAVRACRKGGTFSIMGVYGGFIDKFPMGAAFNKGLTLRMGQMHAHKYLPRLLEHVLRGDVDPSFAATHPVPLDEAQAGYQLFKKKGDECMRVVFRPLDETAEGRPGAAHPR